MPLVSPAISEGATPDGIHHHQRHQRRNIYYRNPPPIPLQVRQHARLARTTVIAQLALVVTPRGTVGVRAVPRGGGYPIRGVYIIEPAGGGRLAATRLNGG